MCTTRLLQLSLVTVSGNGSIWWQPQCEHMTYIVSVFGRRCGQGNEDRTQLPPGVEAVWVHTRVLQHTQWCGAEQQGGIPTQTRWAFL